MVFVKGNELEDPTHGFTMKTTVTLSLGDEVVLSYLGLVAKLGGELRLSDRQGSVATAFGHLYVADGFYRAYGQELKIENGELIYTGGPLSNPGLNITAARKVSVSQAGNGSANYQVGVTISGMIKSPEVSFFSSPSGLSHSQILTYLTLGRDPGNSQAGSAALLLGALSSMKIGGSQSKMVSQQIKDNLGLDELGLENKQSKSEETSELKDNPSLVVGKKITPKLHVSYSMGLLEPLSILNVSYQFSRRFKLVTETDLNSSDIDLIYSVEK